MSKGGRELSGLFSDGILPALIIADGARMEGIEASLFFTFFGLNGLANKNRVDGVLTVGQFHEESAVAGTHILFT